MSADIIPFPTKQAPPPKPTAPDAFDVEAFRRDIYAIAVEPFRHLIPPTDEGEKLR